MTTATSDEKRREEAAEHVARRRERQRRSVLVLRVDVLDELCAAGALRQPAQPTIVDVAAFFGIDSGPLTTLVRRFGDEFREDGWQPIHPDRPGCDLWTDEAMLRAALLLDTGVGAKSEVAEQIRYHLGCGPLPLAFSTSDSRLAQCARLYEKAQTVVGDVHGEQGPAEIWRDLQDTPRYELQALVVALAAMVPDDQQGVGRYLCEVSTRPGQAGSRERGLALMIPRRTKLLKRRRGRGVEPEACQPGGFAATAQR
ncbi:hypothetical protein [Mycobacterium riyadhense]|uniref:hypothetical protein n=1 Tax=Mycobacterium riyadhense TaxID=486698 RepID=UPI00195C85CC|nr:hypothetical protein [Mycobacterium riyadhense]